MSLGQSIIVGVDGFHSTIKLYCVNEASIGVVNPFSHNGRWIYDDATQVARAAKFLAAYDGMQIDF